MMAIPCDVADAQAVENAAGKILREFGNVQVLVNSAGTNIPKRELRVLGVADYRSLIDVNLNGTFYWVHALLPSMRAEKNGTIVNIVSDAGLIANAKAGAAYVASKFGVTDSRSRSTPRSAAMASARRPSARGTSTRRSWRSVRPRHRPRPG